jgi:ribosomal protein L11 methyltransferase
LPPAEHWIHIRAVTHHEAAEAMTYLLQEMGAAGVAVVQSGDDVGSDRVAVDAYFAPDDLIGDRVLVVRRALNSLQRHGLKTSPARVSVRPITVDPDDTSWRSHFPARRIGQRLLVTPSWEPLPADAPDAVVRLDPGMAFGTGTHASTVLVLEALERLDVRGRRVLDVGTGSGILAIAAATLGAAHVTAVDKDATVIPVAAENVARNGVADRVVLRLGTIRDAGGLFDVVLMNILASVIVPALPDIEARLACGGVAVLSGVSALEVEEVEAALARARFAVLESNDRDDWTAFLVAPQRDNTPPDGTI